MNQKLTNLRDAVADSTDLQESEEGLTEFELDVVSGGQHGGGDS